MWQMQYPETGEVIIEDKANGAAIENMVKEKIPGITMYAPHASKEARAAAASVYFRSGNVHLPRNAPWVDDYVKELTGFPRTRYDDQVDMTSQLLINAFRVGDWAQAFGRVS
jgi:predicted phage terminase large subunit-like protein